MRHIIKVDPGNTIGATNINVKRVRIIMGKGKRKNLSKMPSKKHSYRDDYNDTYPDAKGHRDDESY
jgi:hypothetical protein